MTKPTIPFTGVVLAADRTRGDPVAEAVGVSSKSLVPVGGIPMVLRVLNALKGAQEVDKCILCGPSLSAVNQVAALRDRIKSGEVTWTENQATPSLSTYHVLKSLPENCPILVTTADHALLSSRIVDYFCSEARTTAGDIVVGLASYEMVKSVYPETKRTVVKLADGSYCGCNLFAFLTPQAHSAARFWREVEEERKRTWRLISFFGWRAVLLYLLGKLTLAEGLKRASRQMGLSVGVVVIPFAEAAVDVDTVSDWRLVESMVAKKTC